MPDGSATGTAFRPDHSASSSPSRRCLLGGNRRARGLARLDEVADAAQRQEAEGALAAAEQLADEIGRRLHHDLGGRRVLQQLALIHHRDAGAEVDGLLHVVGHQHDGGAEAPLDGHQIFLGLGPDDRVERAERLVHQQHARLGRQRAGDADALLLATRQGVRHAVAELARRQLEQLEQFVDLGVDPGLVPPHQHRHGGDVLRHRAVREQAVALDGVADAAAEDVRGHGAGVLAVDQHGARRSARSAG